MQILAVSSAFPDRVVINDEFPGLKGVQSRMFSGVKERRHVSPGESSVDLFVKALRAMDSTKLPQFDAIFTNVSVPDFPFTGCGAMIAERMGYRPQLVMDLHNGGCVSFVVLLEYAKVMMASQGIKRAIICIAQTARGRIFSHPVNREKPQAAIPGDGAAVALVSLDEADRDCAEFEVKQTRVKCHPEYAWDMKIEYPDGRSYWEPGEGPASIEFSEEKVSSIIMRGNRLVPGVMHELLKESRLRPSDLAGLVTNQPNPYFLRNWRESLQLEEVKHFHTFERYANLFQAGIPVNLDVAIQSGRLESGDRLMLAGFSHAGDYSAAALLTKV